MVDSKKLILVLESNPVHGAAMQVALAMHGRASVSTILDNSPDAIVWLSKNLIHCGVISLNHDLRAERLRDGMIFDPGTGRDVANYLSERSPACPVILHTDSFFVRPRMQCILDSGNWAHTFVSPGNGADWVDNARLPAVFKLLRSEAVKVSL